MKSGRFRILTDTEGNTYQFNTYNFRSEFKKYIAILDSQKNQTTTEGELLEKIADRACVSKEAVKNWKYGNNGPSSYECVVSCAQVLNITPLELLIPLKTNQEINKMNCYDIQLIQKIYGELSNLVYEIFKRRPFYADEEDEEFIKKLNNLHRLIDRESLLVTQKVRYKLHRILIEFISVFSADDVDRWYKLDSSISFNPQAQHLRNVENREDSVCCRGFWYLSEEIELAEKLGLTDYQQVPEDFYEKADLDGYVEKEDGTVITAEEMVKYGLNNYDFKLSQYIVAVDEMINYLRIVFMKDFPELEKEQEK